MASITHDATTKCYKPVVDLINRCLEADQGNAYRAALKEAIMQLLENRDGLMLGICNGFQALVKLGLLPYGEILPMKETSPTITFNNIGRHVSQMVDTILALNYSDSTLKNYTHAFIQFLKHFEYH